MITWKALSGHFQSPSSGGLIAQRATEPPRNFM